MAALITTPALLSTFQKHVEDMRNLVMCKICIKPLYEPYIISCGHTFCYSCLTSWFGGSGATRKREKKCPDCRALVRVQPAPNYLLRDLSHMFISRIELLPEDETTEEHEASKQLETAQMTSDRDGVGLFQGAFKPGVHRDPVFMRPIHDLEDGVDRCPDCAWELEGGMCNYCGFEGFGAEGFSDDDDEEEMDDSDLDDDDNDSSESPDSLSNFGNRINADFGSRNFELHANVHVPPNAYQSSARSTSPERDIPTDSDESEGSDDTEERYGDPIEVRYGDSDISRDSSPPRYRMYSDLDDDDDEDDDDEEDDDDTDMEGFVVRDNEVIRDDDTITRSSSASSNPQTYRRTRRVVFDSDLSGDESFPESDQTATPKPNDRTAPGSDDSSASEESDDETPVPETRLGGRRRPLVIPDDDDDDAVVGDGVFAAPETNPTRPRSFGQDPPQSRASRAIRLSNQRASRRSVASGSGRRVGNDHYHPYANPIRSPSAEIFEARPSGTGLGRGGRQYASRPALST